MSLRSQLVSRVMGNSLSFNSKINSRALLREFSNHFICRKCNQCSFQAFLSVPLTLFSTLPRLLRNSKAAPSRAPGLYSLQASQLHKQRRRPWYLHLRQCWWPQVDLPACLLKTNILQQPETVPVDWQLWQEKQVAHGIIWGEKWRLLKVAKSLEQRIHTWDDLSAQLLEDAWYETKQP